MFFTLEWIWESARWDHGRSLRESSDVGAAREDRHRDADQEERRGVESTGRTSPASAQPRAPDESSTRT